MKNLGPLPVLLFFYWISFHGIINICMCEGAHPNNNDDDDSGGSTFTSTFTSNEEEGIKQTVVEGEENVRLPCPIPTPLPISPSQNQKQNQNHGSKEHLVYTWSLNGHLLENTTRRYQKNSDLFISPVLRERDEGNFTCTVTTANEEKQQEKAVTSQPITLNFIWISPFASVHLSSPQTEAEIRPGVEIILRCQVHGTSHINFQWFRNDQLVPSNSSHGKLLHLPRATFQDNGSYRCQAQNDGGVAQSEGQFNLVVPDEKKKIPRLIKGPMDTVARRRSTVRFDCTFETNNGRVEWFFGTHGPLENSSKYTLFSNGSLILHEIEMSDAGIYKCFDIPRGSFEEFSQNEKVPQIYSAYLKIAYLEELKEEFLEVPLSVSSGAGTEPGKLVVDEKSGLRLELHCRKPDGLPSPVIWWENPGGARIPEFPYSTSRIVGVGVLSNGGSNMRVIPDSDSNSNTLVIENIRRNQSGNYSCVAQNSAGTTRISIQLTVTCSLGGVLSGAGVRDCTSPNETNQKSQLIVPGISETLRFLPFSPMDTKLELGSRNARIHCKAQGNPPPTIRWLKPKEGEPLFQLPNHLIDANGTLHFPTVEKKDGGMYICVASNSQGIINSSIRVEVIAPPKFVMTPRNPTDAVEGHALMINCVASGDPPPFIQWDKDKILNGFDHKRFTVLSNGSLFISKVDREDNGIFGCTAGNSGGFKREEVRLIIKSNDQFILESIEEGNVMTRTVSITLSVAAGYMLLVIGLMLWCRYRQIQRKHAYLTESCKEHGDAEMKETGPIANGNGTLRSLGTTTPTNININQNGRVKKPSSGDSVKSEGETAKSTQSSIGCGREASATASIASNKSVQSKRSCGSSVYDKISYSRQGLQFVMLLGHGQFGEVFLAKAKKLKEGEAESLVMVKSLQTRDESALFDFKREIDMYYKMNHDHVNRLVKLCREMEPHYIIMEYSDWGDLKQFLLATRQQSIRKVPTPPTLTMTQIIQVVSQVALGMEHLSNKRYVHKDLATRNCLISSGLRIKISNPSLSKDTYSSDYHTYKNQTMPIRWIPSEVLLDDDWSTKSDVFSFAVLTWEVIHQASLPFESLSNQTIVDLLERKELVWNSEELNGNRLVPEKLVELLSKCWHPCPTNRPSFSQISIQLNETLQETLNSSSS